MRSNKKNLAWLKSLVLALLIGFAAVGHAADDDTLYKPYVLASDNPGSLPAVIAKTRDALIASGFQIAGEYSPYDGAEVIAVTNPELKRVAARTDFGGYGAVQRVSVTNSGGKIQVAYTNPLYMQYSYRLKGNLSGVAAKLKSALGAEKEFGSKGLTAHELLHYHYKIFMPYFDEQYKLEKFNSYADAVKAVERGLAAHRGGASKVYRVDIPGKQQTVFGVALTDGCSGDKFIMDKIDIGALKSTPHLPYELMVSGNQAYALAVKFRIAQSFPDLSMIGHGGFFSIQCAPNAIKDALYKVVGHKTEDFF